MHTEYATMDMRSIGRKPRRRPLDHRTRGGKRVREVTRILTEAMGGRLSATQEVQVGHAALLVAVSESLQRKHLSGDVVDVDQCIRAANAAKRAIDALNIGERKPIPSPLQALEEHIARTHGAKR
jgi:hypothetical protein